MIRKSFALAAILALCCSSLTAANKTPRIVQIRSKIQCAAEKVTLAEFVRNPEQLTDTELALEIVDTPQNTRTRRISLIGLAYMLQRYEELHDLHLTGPNSILLERTASPIYMRRAKEALLSYIHQTAPWKDWEVDVLLSPGDSRQIGEVGTFDKIKVHTVDNRNRLGNVTFRIGFYDSNDQLLKQLTLHPLVVRQVDAIVLRANRPRGHIISNDDIQLAQTWLGKGRQDAISDITRVIGRELGRPLAAGHLIRAADLMNPVGAKRGDMLWVTALNGSLSVRLSVTALESGRIGQQIRVQNPASKKIFSAELIGPREAQITL